MPLVIIITSTTKLLLGVLIVNYFEITVWNYCMIQLIIYVSDVFDYVIVAICEF